MTKLPFRVMGSSRDGSIASFEMTAILPTLLNVAVALEHAGLEFEHENCHGRHTFALREQFATFAELDQTIDSVGAVAAGERRYL